MMNDHGSMKPTRHLLGLSGGKDSAALAIYLRDRIPEMEYFFADTGAELPETLEYIDRLQDFLGKEIVRLNSGRDFEFYLKLNGNILPTAKSRWCTVELKIRPFEQYVGSDNAITYVAIRADERDRVGYISHKPNITARYPFVEEEKDLEDIFDILLESGVGIPRYYEWRSRSGCYFCFFQRKVEWLGLAANHPELFRKAKEYEEFHRSQGRSHTWSEGEYLDELVARAEEIRLKTETRLQKEQNKKNKRLLERWDETSEDDDGSTCLVCLI